MGGCEEAGAASRPPQRGFDHRTRGAFAVGARDVRKSRAGLGIAKRSEHARDAVEAEFGGLDLVAERVEELDGIRVVHLATVNALCPVEPLPDAAARSVGHA